MASILIIDDENDVGESMRRILERAGFEVHVETAAESGIAAYQARRSDLVITDIVMPGVGGIGVIEAIRRADGGARIMAISGGGNFGPANYRPEAVTTSAYLAAAERTGADAVLTKPFSKSELLAAVGRLLPAG